MDCFGVVQVDSVFSHIIELPCNHTKSSCIPLSLSGPMKLSDILDTSSPLIRVNACMYEYMPHMCIFVTALSNMPLIMLCMFPYGLYGLFDYERNLSYLILPFGGKG